MAIEKGFIIALSNCYSLYGWHYTPDKQKAQVETSTCAF
ncbi:conserved hypothetical protein [Vibrio campbellii HY01]|nr:conserved hypothetical protein [Vibrio campbellii HY01]